MNITKLGANARANVILGAGASRGALCFEGTWAQSPLDKDFFDQIDRLKTTAEGALLSDLVTFSREEFGSSHRPSMEPFFTQLESLDEFHKTLKIDRGPRVRSYSNQLEAFPRYLAAMFRALRSIVDDGELECGHHRLLARSLRSGDTILSFNYDCLIDRALYREGKKRWIADTGYGVSVKNGAHAWHDHSGRGTIAKDGIKLLKVHGSLNWKRNGDGTIDLRRDPYEDRNRSIGEIVPPVWQKRISQDPVLAGVWKLARNSLRTGPILVVIGYSVPETDLLSQVLLRVATSEAGKTLSHLITVNPDPDARSKVRDVLSRALTAKTTIIELTSWTELEHLL